MNKLSLWRDYEWEQFCSSEINSVLEQVECIISANPPRNLLEIALTKLSQIIKFSTHLRSIYLYGEDLDPRLLSTVFEALLRSTAQQKIKVELIFGETSIDGNFLPLSNFLKNCKREIRLCIGNCKRPDGEESDLFANALRHLSCAVAELNINESDLGPDEACALAENLKVNTTLTSLQLSSNTIGVKGAKELANVLKHNGALTELNLRFGDKGAIALAAGLSGGSSLEELRVRAANIGKKGGVALGEALAFSKALEALFIHDNPIGDEGAVAIASSLVCNTTLKILNVEYVDMRTEGCSALACALRSNTSLAAIDISYNRIGHEGVAAVADAIKDNISLKKLQLDDCDIGDDSAIALAEAITCNVTLDCLGLRYNNEITEGVGVTALANGLNRNSTLTDLRLSCYHGGIQFALRRNKALLKEAAWMERFSDQDILLKSKMLSGAMERYSMSLFMELTLLFLKSQVSTIAETTHIASEK